MKVVSLEYVQELLSALSKYSLIRAKEIGKEDPTLQHDLNSAAGLMSLAIDRIQGQSFDLIETQKETA